MEKDEYYQKLYYVSDELVQIEYAIKEFQDDYDVYNLKGNLEKDYISLIRRAQELAILRCQLTLQSRKIKIAS